MELVRTRLAVSSEGTYRGMADCIRRVLKYEGMRAFYRGLLPSLVSRSLKMHSLFMSVTGIPCTVPRNRIKSTFICSVGSPAGP